MDRIAAPVGIFSASGILTLLARHPEVPRDLYFEHQATARPTIGYVGRRRLCRIFLAGGPVD